MERDNGTSSARFQEITGLLQSFFQGAELIIDFDAQGLEDLFGRVAFPVEYLGRKC